MWTRKQNRTDRDSRTTGGAPQADILEVRSRLLGEEHPDALSAAEDLAVSYMQDGKFAEAEPQLVEVLAVSRRVQGAEHKATLSIASSLAFAYSHNQDKLAAAEELQAGVLATRRRVWGEGHPATLRAADDLAYYRHKASMRVAFP